MNKALSIIFVTYNSDDFIFNAIESIFQHNDIPDPIEIIVVDNSPVANIKDKVLSYDSETIAVTFTHNPSNGGYGEAANIAITSSESEQLLFFNPDIELREPILKQTIDALIANRKKIVGYTVVDENDYSGGASMAYGLLPEKHMLNFFYNRYVKKDFYAVNTSKFWNKRIWPSMAALAISKQTLIDAGNFDEDLFLSIEESDILTRIPDRQVEILRARVFHAGGHSFNDVEARYIMDVGSLRFYFKKYGYSWFGFKLHTYISCRIEILKGKLRGYPCPWEEAMLKGIKVHK